MTGNNGNGISISSEFELVSISSDAMFKAFIETIKSKRCGYFKLNNIYVSFFSDINNLSYEFVLPNEVITTEHYPSGFIDTRSGQEYRLHEIFEELTKATYDLYMEIVIYIWRLENR